MTVVPINAGRAPAEERAVRARQRLAAKVEKAFMKDVRIPPLPTDYLVEMFRLYGSKTSGVM